MTIINNIFPRKPPREPVGRYQSLSVEYWNGIIQILPIVASYNLLFRGNPQNDKWVEFYHGSYRSHVTL